MGTLMVACSFCPFSTFGVLAALYLVFLVVLEYYYGNRHPVSTKTSPDSLESVLSIIPVVCFGYQVRT